MSKIPLSPTVEATGHLAARMQKISVVVSLLSLVLMVAGFVDIRLGAGSMSLPGAAALPLSQLINLSPGSLGPDAMSAGILLLALLPAARVVSALWLYARTQDLLNSAAALAVILLLGLSLAAKG